MGTMDTAPTRWRRTYRHVVSFSLGVAILGIGCVSEDDDSVIDASKQSQLNAVSEEPTTTPALIFGVYDTYARASIPAAYLVDDARLVISGHVVEILPAQWTTCDGATPRDPEAVLNDLKATIITPIVIQMDGPPIVNRVSLRLPIDIESGVIVIAALGGRVGEVQVDTNSPSERFVAGEHVLVVLVSSDTAGVKQLVPTSAGLAWSVSHKYVLTPDGEALSYDGFVSELAADIIDRILEAADQLPQFDVVQPTDPTCTASPIP